MKRLLIMFSVLALGVVLAVPAQAATSFTDTTKYTGTSEDSGTCGGNWAVDLYTRSFSAVGSGTHYTVTEKYKGSFLTIAGDSPGKCEATPPHGSTAPEGVGGKFSGVKKFDVDGYTLNVNGSCVRDPSDGLCYADGWVEGFFGSGASMGIGGDYAWSFKYKTKGLMYNSWTNAESGNSGDIASS